MKVVVILLCLAMAALAQAGELFRWVDADGKVHYTDQPPQETAKKVEEKKLSGSIIDTSELPYATQQAVRKSPVTLYANDCGEPCTQARNHLTQRGIPFSSKNPQTTPADAEALTKLVGAAYVPVLVVGSAISKGYEKAAWDAALDAAGYPKSTLLRKAPASGAVKSESPPAAPHPWAGGR
ncbi:MAG: glutaredoxin family protein [Sulfuricella denitrificans]|nr:glutaredoxin family protein [Sulfuricella denitrificans]